MAPTNNRMHGRPRRCRFWIQTQLLGPRDPGRYVAKAHSAGWHWRQRVCHWLCQCFPTETQEFISDLTSPTRVLHCRLCLRGSLPAVRFMTVGTSRASDTRSNSHRDCLLWKGGVGLLSVRITVPLLRSLRRSSPLARRCFARKVILRPSRKSFTKRYDSTRSLMGLIAYSGG